MEDWVIDLQYVPQPLDKIGDICGFNGKNHHCHKGVLSRAKWLYNDLKKYHILKKLFAPDSPYKDHNLVVVGHSLVSSCTCSSIPQHIILLNLFLRAAAVPKCYH